MADLGIFLYFIFHAAFMLHENSFFLKNLRNLAEDTWSPQGWLFAFQKSSLIM
jgi:hypothetical protein